MSEYHYFKSYLTYHAAIDLETEYGSLPVYFSFKLGKVKNNTIEIEKVSPPEMENLLLYQKNIKLFLKKGKDVIIFEFKNIRKSQKSIKANFIFKGKDKRAYFRLNIHRSSKNKFVLNKKFQLISSRVHIKDVSLNPQSYKMITGIGIVVPDYIKLIVNKGDILTITGHKLKIKFEVRWIEKDEIGGRVLSADRDSYQILSALYHDTVDNFLKRFR